MPIRLFAGFVLLAAGCLTATRAAAAIPAPTGDFLAKHCSGCHNADTKSGGLDLDALSAKFGETAAHGTWVKLHDRVRSGEMPPADEPRPTAAEIEAAMTPLAGSLAAIDRERYQREGRARLRRLNRVEFENTLRDLLALPALKIKDSLPEDGKSHGFDRLADALDTSFVHVESYLAAVDKALDMALCPLPEAPPVLKYRYRPWDPVHHEGRQCESSVATAVWNRTAIGLVGMERDATFLADTPHHIQDDPPLATAFGLFRHEDADYRCMMTKIQPYVTGWYRLRVSGYSFDWDGKRVVPTDRHGALGWGIYQKGEHFGIVDLPPNKAAVREITAWLERGGGMNHPHDDFIRIIGHSLQNVRDYANGKDTHIIGPLWAVPGIAVEWVEIEGPLNDQWPPASHRALFGDLPVKTWTPDLKLPKPTQQVWPRGNPRSEPKDLYGHRNEKRPVVYVATEDPLVDAEAQLRRFLRKAFRRPVSEKELADSLGLVKAKLDRGAAFEDALRAAYRQVLTSPEFLFLHEPAGKLSDHALAARLSYFLWSSMPDDELSRLADEGRLSQPEVLAAQAERMLDDPRSSRFVDNFLGQWLALRDIAATAPDRALYPEYMPWLLDAMLQEARAYFTELLKSDLGVEKFVRSDFAFVNEPLAELYGIEGVRGWDVRRVDLPAGNPRGGFLTMAAVLKTTANGTTTSPVKRGAFVMEKLLGIVPTPPPPDIGSVEPDTRGATTIREQLAAHKNNTACAACHQKMDGYGFALESFDVVGGFRDHYRATGGGGPAGKRKIIHGHPVRYYSGPVVDCTGQMPDGRAFRDVSEMKSLLAADPERLAHAFAGHLITYATGAEIGFADRAELERIVRKSADRQYGVRSLLSEEVQSELFTHK